MTNWTPWEVVRHRVAIGGVVSDEAGMPAAGVTVALLNDPSDAESRSDKVAAADSTCITSSDGGFFFLDLDPGTYRVAATDGQGASVEKSAKVLQRKDGPVRLKALQLRLKKEQPAKASSTS